MMSGAPMVSDGSFPTEMITLLLLKPINPTVDSSVQGSRMPQSRISLKKPRIVASRQELSSRSQTIQMQGGGQFPRPRPRPPSLFFFFVLA